MRARTIISYRVGDLKRVSRGSECTGKVSSSWWGSCSGGDPVKTVRKKEPKNTKIEISQKEQKRTSRECKGAVGDIGVSLTPGVGNCISLQMSSKINSRRAVYG